MNNNFQDNAIPNNSATADSEPVLCVECCEFFGNSLYSNLCSGCFKNKQKVKEIPQPEPINNENVDPNEYRIDPKDFIAGLQFLSDNIAAMSEKEKKEKSPVKQADSSKCHKCPRKAGALAFQCKCGHKFCKNHRLPEEHDCTYDFATAEKEKLKVANPVVKGSKMERF